MAQSKRIFYRGVPMIEGWPKAILPLRLWLLVNRLRFAAGARSNFVFLLHLISSIQFKVELNAVFSCNLS